MTPVSAPDLESVAAVFAYRGGEELSVLAWQRAREPEAGTLALPGGRLDPDETLTTSIRRHLSEKVSLDAVEYLEQLGCYSEPARVPGQRLVAVSYLGLVRSDQTAANLPPDTAWYPLSQAAPWAFDYGRIVTAAHSRLAAKLSYTNIGFALAPAEFTMSELRGIYSAVLNRRVDSTNLLRILSRRGVIVPTGGVRRGQGRPASLYRFTDHDLRVTDEFATLRPPP